MNHFFLCFIFFLYSFFSLQGTESTKILTFQKLESLQDYLPKDASVQLLERHLSEFHHHEVEIRGFLYLDGNHKWILSAEPNLKSCCVGKTSKISRQIFLNGPVPDIDQKTSVNIRGLFLIDPKWDINGNLTQLYLIKNANVSHGTSLPLTSLGLFGIGIMSLSSIWILIRRKRSEVDKEKNE